MKASLVVVEGLHLGKVIHLRDDRFEIGRGEGCKLRPKSPAVSNRHCALIRQGGKLFVEDLGSTNGTLVNERRLRGGDSARVGNGDRLQVGELIFRVQVAADTDPDLPNLNDWLNPTDPELVGDPNAQTLPIGTPPPVGNVDPERIKTPSGDAAPAKFAFRMFDKERKVACVGLSHDQVAGNAEVRMVRKALFDMASHRKFRRLVLDLRDVAAILPSLAVAMLLALARRCADGGQLRVCGLRPAVGRMFTAMRFDREIERYDTRAHAITDPWKE